MDQNQPPQTPNSPEERKNTAPKAKLSSFLSFANFGNRQPPEKFPPESWTTEGIQYGGTAGTETVPSYAQQELAQPSTEAVTGADGGDSNDRSQLAIRIRQLIGLLPADPPPHSEGAPPPAPSFIDDKLKSLLSSAAVMNGTKESPSVWSMLERMSPFKPKPVEGKAPEEPEDRQGEPEGVMMYASLSPDEDSKPEIASIAETADDSTTKNEGSADAPVDVPTEKREKKVWVPSPDKLSLEANWWGFRIYLPPPVMASLNNAQPMATKQAAVITTALKWLLDNIPVMMTPPTIRPTLMILKRLIPYVGSIGLFISWSWSSITKYDKGKGVVLTASWLLPVALVPSSWPEGEDKDKPVAPPTEESQAENKSASTSTPGTPKGEQPESRSTWSRLWKSKEKAT